METNNLKNKLSERELEVLKLIMLGLSNQEIGEKLFISYHTVKAHIENIFEKCKCKNKVQATVYAIKQKLIDISELEAEE